MHGGVAHIFGNMLFLWIFGDNVEDALGHLRYFLFYMTTGIIASLAHVFTTVAMYGAGSEQAMVPSLGASGAISGVLGAYMFLFPQRRVTVIMFRALTQVPSYVAIGMWFVFQIVSGLGDVRRRIAGWRRVRTRLTSAGLLRVAVGSGVCDRAAAAKLRELLEGSLKDDDVFTALSTLATLLFIATPSSADEWPQFRGPTGDGISTATHVPVNWSATEHVVWKQAIPGKGWSSPVLSRGKLYLTTAVEVSEDVTSLRALCVDAADGQIVWNVEVFQPEAGAVKEHHSKNSVASPSPILTADRLYVHFGHLGHGGARPQWQDSVAAVEGDLQAAAWKRWLAGSGRQIACFQLRRGGRSICRRARCDNGEVRWRTPRNTPAAKTFSFCTPAVIELDGATQVVSPGSGFVGGYNPQDGKEIWRVRYGEGYSVVPRPVFANGLLFVASGFERPTLLAIDPKGAAGDATDKHVTWSATKGAPLTPSMLAVKDELYTVTDNGVATCFDCADGQGPLDQAIGGRLFGFAGFCRRATFIFRMRRARRMS